MNIKRIKYRDIEEVPHLRVKNEFKQDFQGSSPALFIGKFGYPNVSVGFLSPQFSGDTSYYDSPKSWSKRDAAIGDIASLRYELVNSRMTGNINKLSGRFMEIIHEIGMASKAAEMEVSLNKTPQLQNRQEKEIIPFGPAGEVKKARITTNTKVDSRVERVVSDTDLKAAPAVISLYNKGFEESFLNRLISAGNLGVERNRKLVPTRWSITAVDDTIGKNLIEEVKKYPQGEYLAYFGGSWGNYYMIMFFPDIWSYELFETYVNMQVNPWSKAGYFYSTDYENYAGRKNYAEECAGGYYACRLGVLDKMKELKRQGSCLALRFITSEYNIPLGVWVCREAARKCLSQKPISFSSEELMLQYSKEFTRKKFGFELDLLLKESRLLRDGKKQKKLGQF